jgi:hypothetical protein
LRRLIVDRRNPEPDVCLFVFSSQNLIIENLAGDVALAIRTAQAGAASFENKTKKNRKKNKQTK